MPSALAALRLITKSNLADLETYVRFGSKADIGLAAADVRFTPKSGHG